MRWSGILLFLRVMVGIPSGVWLGRRQIGKPALFLPHLARCSEGRNTRAEGKGRRSRSRVTRSEAQRPCVQSPTRPTLERQVGQVRARAA
jgi:hypothetical protein